MANIKNFGLVGIGTDVQFGKSGPKIVQTDGTFAAKNAAGNAFVRFQIADGIDSGDAVTFQQLGNAIANVAGSTDALQDEIDAIETGAGLNADGTFTAPVGSNYLANATSLKDASALLDVALFAEAGTRAAADLVLTNAVAAAVSSIGDLQAELDQVETSVGLGIDGMLTLAAGNYLGNATSIVDAVETLDGAIKTVSDVADAANATATQAAADILVVASDLANTAANVVVIDGRVDTLEATANATTNSVVALEANVATLQQGLQDNYDADALLEARVDALENDGSYAQLAQDLADETNARVAADAVLTSGLANAVSAIANTDANAVALSGVVSDLSDDLLQEVQDRIAADSAEANARTLADGILTSDIANTNADLAALAANAVLKDGSVAFTGALSMGNNAIHDVADPVLSTDAANKQWVEGKVAALGNAFNYVGVLANAGVDAGSAFDLATLPTDGKNPGDYYKVTAAGYFTLSGDTQYFNTNDGLVFNTSASYDKIDNTDASVTGTSGEVTVTGSVDTGFVVGIDGAYTVARQLEVSNEANARVAADSALSNAIVAEANARTLADAALTTAIANTNANVVVVAAGLAQEVSDRANAVTAEADARILSDAGLTAEIANTNANAVLLTARVTALEEDGSAANAIAELQQDLSDETNARVAADTLINSNVATVANSVVTETAARIQGDSDEANARVAADAVLTGAISTEANARVAADAILTSGLANAVAAIASTDANVTALAGTVGDIQDEVDAIEAGAGLGTDGSYTANATSNYLANATTLFEADQLLDAAVKGLADDLATLSQDTIKTNDDLNSVHVSDKLIETKLNVGNAATTVLTVVATDNTDSALAIDAGTAGEVALRVTGSATDVDLRLVGQGAGHVIIGETGAGFIQADDTYDMTVAGGDNGGKLNLYGNAVLIGDAEGTTIAQFAGVANASSYVSVFNGNTSVEIGVDGTGANLDLVFAPKGTGSVDVSSARVVNVANAIASTDAATLGQVQTAVAASEVGHVKTVVATLTETNGAVNIGGLVTGTVLRIRVLVTGAFNSGVSITVGSAGGTATELAAAADIDEGAAGIYIVETAKDYTAATLQATISGAVSGSGSAKVYVEYLAA